MSRIACSILHKRVAILLAIEVPHGFGRLLGLGFLGGLAIGTLCVQ
jgi:hypothetical protein